jgi:hypothetical protein
MKRILHTLALLAVAGFFTAGFASAQIIEKGELKKLIATANTAADHERLSKHYEAKAVQLEAESKDHKEEAAEYRRSAGGHEAKHPMSGKTAGHCEYFAQKYAEAAKEARQLAADHMAMAKGAK